MNTELIEQKKQFEADLVDINLIRRADDLAREHEEFNQKYIVSGRNALYELLGKIYTLSEQLDNSFNKKEQISLLRIILAKKYGIRTQENTSDTTVLVRYITKADRKTAHVYSRAIEAARAKAILSVDFAEYIEQADGVERIRADSIVPKMSQEELDVIENNRVMRLELARKYLKARTELPIASFRLGKRYSRAPKTGGITQFVCYERGGRFYVLTEQSFDKDQEFKLVERVADESCIDLKRATKNINAFYTKAMLKRKRRTIREISRKRPDLGLRLEAKIIGE
jgi:hypothetical protein